MKLTKTYTGILVALAFATCGAVEAQTTVTLADAAGDFVASLSAIDAEPTALPDGWTYLAAAALDAGAEPELGVLAGLGNANNTGFGTAEGGNNFGIPAVLGNQNTADEFEVFSDGFDGNGGTIPTGNEGVVGEDLLLVPGSIDEFQFVIARYTISAADVSGATAGTGSISGSFRDLVAATESNGNNGGSIDVFVMQNSTVLFSVDREDDVANAGMLSQADGTFNVTGLTFAAGDTISFVVGNNGNVGGDETALQASISVESSGATPTVLLGDVDCNNVVDFLDIGPFVTLLTTDGFKAQADINLDGDVTFLDIGGFVTILTGG